MKVDFLIVGSGLYGAVFAQRAKEAGYRYLVLEKRATVGGNAATETIEDITVHTYGAHIFHTSRPKVWDYVNRFAEFNRYTNCPMANYKGRLYNLPFNMNTFYQMWGTVTPQEAWAKIEEQRAPYRTDNPQNLEEKALAMVGPQLFETLVRHYTEKQWGRPCKELPAFIIGRLPLRFTYDNNYFSDPWQGIPQDGYTPLVQRLLQGIEVRLHTDYLEKRTEWNAQAACVVYTGPIDAYFDYKLGALEYRSLRFETQVLDCENAQGNAVVNYTDADTPYTRIIEHKHFAFGTQPKTVVTKEYSATWHKGTEPYYPVNDEKNNNLYNQYRQLAERETHMLIGGRLGEYQYLNMDQAIERALAQSEPEQLAALLVRGG